MKSSESWELEARNWAAWARAPGHDDYWRARERFFELVPPPGSRTLEVGCGEGRVSRDLAARGHDVVGLDASPTLVALAREAAGGPEYVLGHAEELPFADGAFDLAVAHNSLMDVDDMPQTVCEVARVLEPGGRFCVCVTHPLMDAGRFEGDDREAPFLLDGSYFGRRRFDETVERDGLNIRFNGWTYSLSDYTRALDAAGFLIEALREPADPGRERRMPWFLHLRCRRR